MARKMWIGIMTLLAAVMNASATAQERRQAASRIDVEPYTIEAEVNPRTQSLNATVHVRFMPLDEVSSTSFELNNGLNVSKIVDDAGRQIPASRSQSDFSVRLSFPEPLPKGRATTLTFTYDGRLTGNEESPVYGIKFAALQNDFGYLMYPARWFPVSGYTTDRYTADLKIVTPAEYRVISGGLEDNPDRAADGKMAYRFRFTQPTFPGSIAFVMGEPQRVSSSGVTTAVYFRTQKDMAQPYGDEIGKVMAHLTSIFGLAPQASLAVVETEEGTPNGYSAPGVLFFNPRAIGKQVSPRLLANQIARQWWGVLVSPATRNHVWIQNGAARYAELLYLEHLNGPGALENELRDTYIEALTVENVPLIQSARFEDYSPEFWAATAGKGAAVFSMLRTIAGDEKFGQMLKNVLNTYSWKSISTEDFRKAAEAAIGQKMDYFFLQWVESSGAPEFKLDYTVFRNTKGFRVMAQVVQVLGTF